MVSSNMKLLAFSKPTRLLSLPNELLQMIFEFLSTIDLIQSILFINHPRLNVLIYPLISRIDLTKFFDERVKTIFNLISSARINTNQINQIRMAPSLCSLYMIQNDPTDLSFLSFLPHFTRNLNSLSLECHPQCNIDTLLLPALIFQPNCSLETLAVLSNRIQISIEPNHVVPCPSLKRVTLSIAGFCDLFILCEHLISLEYLQILSLGTNVNDKSFNFYRYISKKSFSNHLHVLKISGRVDYARTELFVQQFASSLQYLTFKISTMNESVDGHRIKAGLINVCTQLKKFKFLFRFDGDRKTFIDHQSFQSNRKRYSSNNYWSSHPVVCFDTTIASLPYTETYFRSIGNEFPNTIYFNVPNPPSFKYIRHLTFTGHDGPLSLDFFKFIERIFSHVESFYFSNECYLVDSDWKLLPQFPRVTTLTLGVWYTNIDEFNNRPVSSASVLVFFSLLPNIRRLQTSLKFLQSHERFLRSNRQLQGIFDRIEEVKMPKYANKQQEPFARSLFPNAKISFDYISHEYF